MKTIEPSLKIMRDYVYDQRGSEHNWNECREFWEKDSKWLMDQFLRLPRPLPAYQSLPLPKGQ